MPVRIAIIGYGKIARDQHIPSIHADPRFELVAVSSRNQKREGVRNFADHRDMLRDMAGQLDAVALCTPPTARLDIAGDCFAAGMHLMLEKPPAATLGEIEEIVRLGAASGQTLFASWHSQQAAGVAGAREALKGATVSRLDIRWHEDVRKWHPGQEWIWAAGGFGVFDPGINALSIATHILPAPLFVRSARLLFPANRQTPIAARIDFHGPDQALRADFDWRSEAGESWSIRIETEAGKRIDLLDGGARLLIDETSQPVPRHDEYAGLYARFAELIEGGESEVDTAPLRITADAFLVGEREIGPAFE